MAVFETSRIGVVVFVLFMAIRGEYFMELVGLLECGIIELLQKFEGCRKGYINKGF